MIQLPRAAMDCIMSSFLFVCENHISPFKESILTGYSYDRLLHLQNIVIDIFEFAQ
jgi:hypothetical protein